MFISADVPEEIHDKIQKVRDLMKETTGVYPSRSQIIRAALEEYCSRKLNNCRRSSSK